MNKLVKRLVSGALSLVLVGALSVSAFAEGPTGDGDSTPYTGVTETGHEVTVQSDSTDSDNLQYTLTPATFTNGYYIDVTYGWNRALTWTYLKDTTAGSSLGTWVYGTNVGSDNATKLTTYKNWKAKTDTWTADASGYAAKANDLGVIFKIHNNSGDYAVNYAVADAGAANVKFTKEATVALGGGSGSESLYDSGTRVTLLENDFVASIDATSISTGSDAYVVVVPDTAKTVTDSTVTANMTITFSHPA